MATAKELKISEERRQAELADGRFAAQESEDNAIAVSNDAFVGVSPEYANYANEQDAPLKSEDPDQAALEDAAREDMLRKAIPADQSNVNGYVPSTPHPSEAKGPVDRIIERNEKIAEAMASSADDHMAEKAKAVEESGGDGSSTPGIAGT